MAKPSWGFESVDTERLSNIYDHICSTTSELVDALQDAESNEGVSIKIGAGTFALFDELGSAITPSSGTTIEGTTVSQSGFAVDGINADLGTVIDVAGNTLFSGNEISGLNISQVMFDNPTTVFDFGDDTTRGLSTSHFEDVAFASSNDVSKYPIVLHNSHRVDMDRVVTKSCPLLIDVQQTLSNATFQSGNCKWGHILASGGTGVSTAPIRLEATDGSLNYITMIRPQVINGGVSTGDGSACIHIIGSGSSTSQQHTIIGADLEGDWDNKVRITAAANNFIEVAGVAGTSNTDVYLESGATDNTVLGQRAITVNSENEENVVLGKIDDISGSNVTGFVYNKTNSRPELYPGNTAFTWQFRSDRVQINTSGTPLRNFGDFWFNTPQDLSGVTGSGDGHVRLDDGTNTTNWGTACTWRNSDSSWYPHDGSASFQ